MSSFDALTKWVVGPDGVPTVVVPADWAQGRATFGGIVSAAGLEAVLAEVPDAGPVRSVQSQFLGPVVPELPAHRAVRVLRRGRSLTVAEAHLTQDDTLRAVITVTLGQGRSSRISVASPASPGGPAGEGVHVGHIPGVTPSFLQHLELRWVDGQPPFTGASEAVVGGWCRHGTEAHGVGAVIGLLDAWPAPVLALLDEPAPASTVHWTAHLVGSIPEPGVWCRFHALPVSAGEGYVTTRGHLWDETGDLIAWMEQLVAVFDTPTG